jgi:5-(carboxyamino)imidazole ribonucleotide synthase
MHPGLKVGILGGGQLARMLILQGHQLGLQMHVLSEHKDDPAAQVTSHWHHGKTSSLSDVSKFIKAVDYVTFESEFVPAHILERISGQKNIFPKPGLLMELQDRNYQKALLVKFGIPTSPYVLISSDSELRDVYSILKYGCVLKKRLGGYDGKGTFVLKSPAQLDSFLKSQDVSKKEFIAESFISFKRELALQVARNQNGEVLFFPLVEITQKDNRLDYLVGPVAHPKLAQLQQKIKTFLNATTYVGVIAFELFDTGKDLMVNEIAPRVHNSGHYTIEALSLDQFTAHLVAGLNLKFNKLTPLVKSFAMTNLIGAGSSKVTFPKDLEGHLHWYGKEENKPGRKIGHVTYLGLEAKKTLRTALSERKRMKL